MQLGTVEAVANAYHAHLREGNVILREPRFLPQVIRCDRKEAKSHLGFSIYLDNLRSAHNVGSILRTVEAFRLGAVYFSSHTPWITNKQVQATSMGAYQWVHCEQASIKTLSLPLIALESAKEGEPLNTFTFPPGCTLVVGNEEYGCSEEALDLASALIQIPLRGRKSSLNVANAFAICANAMASGKVGQS